MKQRWGARKSSSPLHMGRRYDPHQRKKEALCAGVSVMVLLFFFFGGGSGAGGGGAGTEPSPSYLAASLGSTLRSAAAPQVIKYEAVTTTQSDIRACSAEQAALQGQVFALAKVRGCPPTDDVWMRMVQTLMPRAKTFIDIGSNKGFTGARFFSLWNPELGYTPGAHYKELHKVSTDPTVVACGACADCQEDGGPMVDMHARLCSEEGVSTKDGNKAAQMAKAAKVLCSKRQDEFQAVRVHSFDGNPVLVNAVSAAIQSYKANPNKRAPKAEGGLRYLPTYLPADPGQVVADSWTVELRAFTSECAPGQELTFMMDGELGHIGDERDQSAKARKEAKPVKVPCITVDQLIDRDALGQVDILKIDTEGFDLGVLDGAKAALKRNQINVILFEYNTYWPEERRGEPPLKAIVEDLADDGYVCYLEGKNSMVRLTKCWDPVLARKQWSNIYCASVQKVPALVQALDSYSMAFAAA